MVISAVPSRQSCLRVRSLFLLPVKGIAAKIIRSASYAPYPAVLGVLDEEHPRLPQNPRDSNLYYLGQIGDHNIVITCMPAGRIGLVFAARVAMQMQISFACIQKGLMVGIGGGVPSEQHDIRLGDIVVSQSTGQYGGVVQYDFGKSHPGGVFERTGSLCPPPDVLLAVLNGVKVFQLTNRVSIAAHLSSLVERLPDYKFPSQLSDHYIIHIIYTRVDQAVVIVAQKTEYDVNQDLIDFFLWFIMAQLLLVIGS